MTKKQTGPLAGYRVVEFVGIGPGPYCGHLLAEMGAEVIMIDRPSKGPYMIDSRGKKSMILDLRKPEGIEAALKLIDTADALIEGNRPGVAERLGFGPDVCRKRNPKLVYGRMTGWGQEGPWSSMAGHDINYLSITGFLHMTGKYGEPPTPPLNLVGDFGGGSTFLAMGMLAAMLSAQKTGKGDVVDAAIVDGVSSMLGIINSLSGFGLWTPEREDNLLDGGAPFYRCYKTADEKFMAVGCIEPQFFAIMMEKTGLSQEVYGAQNDKVKWPHQHKLLESVFGSRTRDEWCAVFDGTDACITPVLEMSEVEEHPHNKARGSHVKQAGMLHPQMAPRLGSLELSSPASIPTRGADTAELLKSVGCSDEIIQSLT